jgi:DNA-binding MarR family transcriptional regulator
MEKIPASQNISIQSLKRHDWDKLLQRIMTSYNDISRSINPKGLLKINLTTAQIKLLTCFSDKDTHSMTELSISLAVSMPTITAMVDRLETANMVKRERNSVDRRVVQVRLTAAGKRELKKLSTIRKEEMEKILMNLSETEMNTFLGSIELVARLLTKARHQRDLGVNNM